jgi:hypothetical protein
VDLANDAGRLLRGHRVLLELGAPASGALAIVEYVLEALVGHGRARLVSGLMILALPLRDATGRMTADPPGIASRFAFRKLI